MQYCIRLFFLFITLHLIGFGEALLVIIIGLALLDSIKMIHKTNNYLIGKKSVIFFILNLITYIIPVWFYSFWPLITI